MIILKRKRKKKNTHEFTTEKNDIFFGFILILVFACFVVVLMKFCVTRENNKEGTVAN